MDHPKSDPVILVRSPVILRNLFFSFLPASQTGRDLTSYLYVLRTAHCCHHPSNISLSNSHDPSHLLWMSALEISLTHRSLTEQQTH